MQYRKDKNSGNTPPFHLCAYILDALCFNSKFPILGWKLTSQELVPIHIYHKLLWKVHFKNHVYRICHDFFYLSIRPFLTNFLPGSLKKQRMIYPLLEIGLEKRDLLISEFLEALYNPISYLYMFLTNY